MVFSSLTFLLLYLPAVLSVYYLAPQKLKNLVLFLFSLLFYAWGEPVYVGLMIFSTILDYCCGRAAEKYRGTNKAKAALIVSVTVNLGLLCLFKYTDFLLTTINSVFGLSVPLLNLPLPIGISFYTFQTMSYTIDVYRGDTKAQKNIISFGAYVSLFPQLIAGPIVRYQTIAEQIDHRVHTSDLFSSGVKRFVCGLAKKVLLANNIGLLWSTISQTDVSKLTAVSAWLGIIGFGAGLCDNNALWQLVSYLPLLTVCVIASTPIVCKVYKWMNEKCVSGIMTVADSLGLTGGMLLSTAYLISWSYNPFLYFRF